MSSKPASKRRRLAPHTGLHPDQHAGLVGESGSPPSDIWHPKLAPLFPRPPPACVMDEDELQSFDEFEEMGQREPNEEGTGRRKVTRSRRDIVLVQLGASDIPVSELVPIFEAFFALPVRVLPPIKVVKSGKARKKMNIISPDETLAFPLSMKCGKVDVFSVFDVLVESCFLDERAVSLVALTNETICEPDYPRESIVGRACGDGVCVVSTEGSPRAEVVATALHECLHTFGLDHCIAWHCIMNSNYDETESEGRGACLHLCPMDLRKLQLVVGFDVTLRYRRLQSQFMASGLPRAAEWIKRRLGIK